MGCSVNGHAGRNAGWQDPVKANQSDGVPKSGCLRWVAQLPTCRKISRLPQSLRRPIPSKCRGTEWQSILVVVEDLRAGIVRLAHLEIMDARHLLFTKRVSLSNFRVLRLPFAICVEFRRDVVQ
jgi:hypothetical protein